MPQPFKRNFLQHALAALTGVDNDSLLGGAGNDSYVFSDNFGLDTVLDSDGIGNLYDTRGENNILRFGAGVNQDNVKLNLGSLLLNLGNGDAVHIAGFDQNNVFNSSSIDGFEFADGTLLTTNERLTVGAVNDMSYGNSTERKAA